MPIRLHEDDSSMLQEAIRFTAAETGFSPRIIEKDYFCSVLLEYLAASSEELTFKGGTCLAKIHVEFYRLSEDLDFTISTPLQSSRSQRRQNSDRLRTVVSAVPETLRVFRIVEPLRGANNSTQYNVVLGYESLLDAHLESINVEVGQREPNMTETQLGTSKTALLNPINGQALVDPYPVRCLSYLEAMVEKLRAALCRREVAIRDFFDVDYAVRNTELNTRDPALLDLLRRKLEVPGTGPVDVSPDRMGQLQRQLEAQLRPVLREREFDQFDLERAIGTVSEVAREVS